MSVILSLSPLDLNFGIDYVLNHLNPYHLLLHGVMTVFILYLLVRRPTKVHSHPEQLSKQEQDELINEWSPIPLCPTMTKAQERNAQKFVISKVTSARVTVNGQDNVLHLARSNYLGFIGHPKIEEVAIRTLRKYGCGSCGPRGFYGTIDLHMFLEQKLASFMRTPEAIVYSSGFATISSAIPAFSKMGDLIFCDSGVSHAVNVGCTLSRSKVLYFKHNDVHDLKRLLDAHPTVPGKLPRKFVVLEGLYYNYGDIAPLPEIMKLKEQYKFRIILDESHAFGVLGNTGRGSCEHFGIDINDLEIVTASLSNSIGSGGGFCLGSKTVVSHQRLNGLGYCFSASLPPFLSACSQEAIEQLEQQPEMVAQLAERTRQFHDMLGQVPSLVATSSPLSPVIHLRLSKSLGDRDRDEDALEAIVMKAFEHGILLTRAKYIDSEKYMPPPSIRIGVSTALSPADVEQSVKAIASAAESVLRK